jgi:hypothetical protein
MYIYMYKLIWKPWVENGKPYLINLYFLRIYSDSIEEPGTMVLRNLRVA